MGNNSGSKLPCDPDLNYFVLMFQGGDRIKLALADDQTVAVVRRACLESWPYGLQQDVRCSDGSHKLKFTGMPFAPQCSGATGRLTKRMAVRILSDLRENGWMPVVSSELSRRTESSSWFFRRCCQPTLTCPSPPPSSSSSSSMGSAASPTRDGGRRRRRNDDQRRHRTPSPRQTVCRQERNGRTSNGSGASSTLRPRMFCLSLCSYDKIQLIHGNEALKELLRRAVRTAYGPGVDEERSFGDDHEIKLRGKPWWHDVEQPGENGGPWAARKLLLELVRRFHQVHYSIYVCVNLGDASNCLVFSETEPSSSPGDLRFSLLSLHDDDRLLLIDAEKTIVDTARVAILDTWPKGLQSEMLHSDHNSEITCEFKVKGRPWKASGPEAVCGHRFLTNLLRALLERGWGVDHSLEISRRAIGDKTTVFILRSCEPRCWAHACLNLNDVDKIRVIGDNSLKNLQGAFAVMARNRNNVVDYDESSNNTNKQERQSNSMRRRLKSRSSSNPSSSVVSTPRLMITAPSDEHLATTAVPRIHSDLVFAVRRTIERTWPYGIERIRDYYGSREFRLHGCPWAATAAGMGAGNRALLARVAMCYVLRATLDAGWILVASADISSRNLGAGMIRGAAAVNKSAGGGANEHYVVGASMSEVHSWFLAYAAEEQPTLLTFGQQISEKQDSETDNRCDGKDVLH